MNKPEYGDLYKFAASVGVVLISLAFLFPWLLLRESFDTLQKVSDIQQLTPVAQELLAYRQNTALWWVKNVQWVSIISAFFGVLFLGAGVFSWRKKQVVTDRMDSAKAGQEEVKLSRMQKASAETMVKSKTDEVVEQAQAVAKDSGVQKPTTPSEINQYVGESFRLEKIVTDKLSLCFSSRGQVINNQEIRFTTYDIIFRSAVEDLVDIIVKLKYARNTFAFSYVRDIIYKNAQSIKLYCETNKRPAIGVIIFVSEEKTNIDETKLEDAKKTILSDADLSEVKLRIYFMRPEQVEQLDCTELQRMIT